MLLSISSSESVSYVIEIIVPVVRGFLVMLTLLAGAGEARRLAGVMRAELDWDALMPWGGFF
jgi:hypothetical protein